MYAQIEAAPAYVIWSIHGVAVDRGLDLEWSVYDSKLGVAENLTTI